MSVLDDRDESLPRKGHHRRIKAVAPGKRSPSRRFRARPEDADEEQDAFARDPERARRIEALIALHAPFIEMLRRGEQPPSGDRP